MFQTDLRGVSDNKYGWIILSPLIYNAKNGHTITVPPGFHTDLASIPRIFQWIFPVNDKHRSAAVLHDYLIAGTNHPKKYRDQIFLEAMLNSNVEPYKAYPIYWAVKLFGP